MNNVLQEDVAEFVEKFPLSNELHDATFLITGATGLIGSTLVHCLLALNKNINITVPVRNKEKANKLFEENDHLSIVECDLVSWLQCLNIPFDYVIHCASPTAGKFMVEHPVETYELAIESTKALLSYVKSNSVKGFVYISSLESYGQILSEHPITEVEQGYIDVFSPRSSYPMGKKAAEYLCFAYASEYNIPVKIARLTQTFGAGVAFDDPRVFAQFARSAINGMDIVMHTKGESAKPYCYTIDCVSAILYILLKGANGEAYNVANEDTYVSIRTLAEFIRDTFNPKIQVIIEEKTNMGYAPVTKLKLCTDKLKSLGWNANYDLKRMISRLIESMK